MSFSDGNSFPELVSKKKKHKHKKRQNKDVDMSSVEPVTEEMNGDCESAETQFQTVSEKDESPDLINKKKKHKHRKRQNKDVDVSIVEESVTKVINDDCEWTDIRFQNVSEKAGSSYLHAVDEKKHKNRKRQNKHVDVSCVKSVTGEMDDDCKATETCFQTLWENDESRYPDLINKKKKDKHRKHQNNDFVSMTDEKSATNDESSCRDLVNKTKKHKRQKISHKEESTDLFAIGSEHMNDDGEDVNGMLIIDKNNPDSSTKKKKHKHKKRNRTDYCVSVGEVEIDTEFQNSDKDRSCLVVVKNRKKKRDKKQHNKLGAHSLGKMDVDPLSKRTTRNSPSEFASEVKEMKYDCEKKNEINVEFLNLEKAEDSSSGVQTKKKKRKREKERIGNVGLKQADASSSVGNAVKREHKDNTVTTEVAAITQNKCHSNVSSKNTSFTQDRRNNEKAGQWGTASFESEERQQKFIRLLGGLKKSSGSDDKMWKKASLLSGGGNLAMTKNEESSYVQRMESQFTNALSHNFRRGTGLGFEMPPDAGKTFYIDKSASKSMKFQDSD